MKRLEVLQQETAAIAERIVTERPDWPCRRGCDHCCRSLAEPIRMSRAEWELVSRVIDPSAMNLDDPRICPLLDRATGACTIYDARPIACRAYGFYYGRDGGRFCGTIEDAGCADTVILGNHDALERDLEALGETRTLAEWLTLTKLPAG